VDQVTIRFLDEPTMTARYDPDHAVTEEDMPNPGATSQDDFDPDSADGAYVTSIHDPRIET